MLLLLLALQLTATSDEALAVYEQGKVLYDQKRYEPALAKFDEAARLEPTKARWHYNRGLALKKLGRDSQALDAFTESRRLEPDYKRSEIDQKLSELSVEVPSGDTPAPLSAETLFMAVGLPGLLFCGVFTTVLVVAIRLLLKALRQPRAGPINAPAPAIDPAASLQLRKALSALGTRLSRLHHVVSLGEDPDALSALDRAHTNFQLAKRGLHQRRPLAELSAALERAAPDVHLAEQRLSARHGAACDTATGPRVGCFFCARPLPTAGFRFPVTLTTSDDPTQVLACKSCSRVVAQGGAPPVMTATHGGAPAHWATAPNADPYALAYQPDAREVPLGQLGRDGADLQGLATAAGVAIAGAAVGAAVARALDIDALAESLVSADATAAAARSAADGRSSSSWKDHS